MVKIDNTATHPDMIASLKVHVTKIAKEMFALTAQVALMADLLANQANTALVTRNTDGASSPTIAVVLVAAAQHSDDAGSDLFKAACSDDRSMVQTLLSAPGVQS